MSVWAKTEIANNKTDMKKKIINLYITI